MARPKLIQPRELRERLTAGEVIQLVDVREDEELRLARLREPVLHLPLSRSEEWIPGLAEQLRREQPVAVICHAGVRSWHLACWLIDTQGYEEVWNVQGGIDAWSLEVDPEVPRY
ncbi:MAG: rhodanese-like domain-containing protein [Cyanobacteriota bacterium]